MVWQLVVEVDRLNKQLSVSGGPITDSTLPHYLVHPQAVGTPGQNLGEGFSGVDFNSSTPAGVHQLNVPGELWLDVAHGRGHLPPKDYCRCKGGVYAGQLVFGHAVV